MRQNYLAVGMVCCGVLAFVGCGSDSPVSSSPSSDETIAQTPSQSGSEVLEGYFLGEPISYVRENGRNVFQGDILIPDELITPTAALAKGTSCMNIIESLKWPNRIVYYVIANGHPNATLIRQAIAHWESTTTARFVARSVQNDYVNFVSVAGNVSSSYIGRIGGSQALQVGTSVSKGVIVHEIGHALGLWHEHSRAGRDTAITVHWRNIDTTTYGVGVKRNFEIFGAGQAQNIGAFDFGSIMLYACNSFAFTGRSTLTKRDGTTWVANATALSAGDIAGYNSVYTSAFAWKTLPTLPGNAATDIGCGGTAAAPVVFAISGNPPYSYLQKWTGTAWARINTSPVPAGPGAVDVDGAGMPYVLSSGLMVYKGSGSGTTYTWTQLAQVPGGARDIGVGPNGTLYAVGATQLNGVTTYKLYKLTSGAWVEQVNPSKGAIRVTVDNSNLAWFIDCQGSVWRQHPTGWGLIVGFAAAPSACDIGAGADGTVFLRSNSEVRVWSNTGKMSTFAGSVAPRSLDVDPAGNPWCVQMNGNAYN